MLVRDDADAYVGHALNPSPRVTGIRVVRSSIRMSGIFTLRREATFQPNDPVKTPDIGIALSALFYSGDAWGGLICSP